jgi:ABC-2 type transport system ATP-binding protein
MVEDRIIDFKGVRKEFKDKVVLNDVSLSINKGEIFGVIGLSGSGKTTLFNTLIGFLEPDAGQINYYHNGKQIPISKDNEVVKTHFGFATQEPSFYPKLTAMENLDHFGALYRIKKRVREQYIDFLLKLVDLYDARDTISSSLSGGMQKRLTIACALIHNPKVLILDEPTADLDPYLRNKAWDIIKSIRKNGTTVLISSHLLDEVDLLCDRIAILHNGVILEMGTPDELKDKYSMNEEIELETKPGRYDAICEIMKQQNVPISKILIKHNRLILYTPEPEFALHKLINTIEDLNEKLIEINVNKPSLAEVFESLTYKNVGFSQ